MRLPDVPAPGAHLDPLRALAGGGAADLLPVRRAPQPAAGQRGNVRRGHPGYATVISVGALVGLTTVMMILLLGQSRVFFAMSRDRLLPPVFSTVSSRTGTPVRTTIVTGVVVAVIATFIPLSELAELVNIGTLFAFILVAAGVLVLRRTR
ncbi:MAG: amino acid permease, partial [Gemmatimonadetes bacterium]|nr:amino acid permease [Gemmatimonadota bacterium]